MSATVGKRSASGASEKSPETNSKTQAHKTAACAGCKRLKIKCVRTDPTDPTCPCMRCLKKEIECVQGKTFKRHPDEFAASNINEVSRKKQEVSPGDGKEKHTTDSVHMREQLMTSWKLLTGRDDLRIKLLGEHALGSFAKPTNNVISRGLLTLDQVMERIHLYNTEIYPKFPIIATPPGETFEEMLRRSPVLLHTILDIASLLVTDKSQTNACFILHNTVLKTVIDEIMVASVKNFELLQCLVLLTHWYNESELYHQQRLHALTALAVSVSHDLGIGGSVIPNTGLTTVPAFEQMVAPQMAFESQSPESYRIWLGVYTTLFQSLLANRRPVVSLWNSYTEQSINVTKAQFSPTADPTVFQIWDLAKLRHLQEGIIMELYKNNNEPVAPDFTNPTVQYLVTHFDSEIDNLERTTSSLSVRGRIASTMCRILLHQAVLYTNYDESLGRAPFTNFSLNLYSSELPFAAARSFTISYRSAIEVLSSVVKRNKRELADETSSFWTALTLSCDVLLKCRACCIFNKNYAAVCFVSDQDLSYIIEAVIMCDELIEEYPNCNNAVSFGFFIKLLLCHHDARFHFYSSRIAMSELGDPRFVLTRAGDSDVGGLELQRDKPPTKTSTSHEYVRPHYRNSLSKGCQLPTETPLDPLSFVSEEPPIFEDGVTRVNSVSPSQIQTPNMFYPQQYTPTPTISPKSEKHDLEYSYLPPESIPDPLQPATLEAQVMDSTAWKDIENFWKDFLSQSGSFPFT